MQQDAHRRLPHLSRPAGPTDDPSSLGDKAEVLGDNAEALAAEVAAHVLDVRAEWRWTWGDSLRVAAAGFTLVIGGLVASRGVPSWEASAFLKVNALSEALYPLLWPPMQLGNVWVGTAVAAGVGLLVRRWRSGVLLTAVPVVAWMVAKAVKSAVDRGRPSAVGLLVQQRGAPETGLGFVSGHAAVAFAIAGAMSAHLRRPWNALPLMLAAVVGFARIYVGAHLPLDVVGGAACGLLIGEAARVIELRLARRATAD